MSILIVEDNPVSARMLEVTLQKNGYSTVRARTGREALDELREHGTQIEMVITDIMMPEMDGLELFSAIRSNPKWRSLPVVVASAAADAGAGEGQEDPARRGITREGRDQRRPVGEEAF